MTEPMRTLLLVLALGACYTRPAEPTLIQVRAVELYADGASLEELATDLTHGDRAAARELVYRGMLALQRRYYRDR